ncbi:MAG: mechanosensitive ion channel family protein [Myxococcales bacterium]
MSKRSFALFALLLVASILGAPAVHAQSRLIPRARAQEAPQEEKNDESDKDADKHSDEHADGGADKDVTDVEVAPDSPRASMAEFVKLCRKHDFEKAAGFLEIPKGQAEQGAQLAERLKAVLDRRAWLDVDKLSPLSTGNLDDDLPRSLEQVADLKGKDQVPAPVRLVKRETEQGTRWLFTLATVNHIDDWYLELDDRWLREHLPAWLLRSGPKELLLWQWFAMPLLVLVGWGLGYLVSRLIGRTLNVFTSRTATHWDDELVRRTRGPLTLWCSLFVCWLLLPWLSLYAPAHQFVHGLMRGLFFAGFFWLLSRSIGVGSELLSISPWAQRNGLSRSLVPLLARVGHVALFAVAAVALLSQLGYPVASLIAGLGVGGLAVALAAQKTLENLFGAFAIGADQPFREGDTVTIDNFTATVESIGLRSTRFRTADRTLITIPNGKLSDMKLESLTARDRLRFACTLSLAYGTSASQVREVRQGVEQVLRAEPKLRTDGLTTRVLQFGASSIDLEVSAYVNTVDGNEFAVVREQLLLSFMEVVEKAGTSLAMPTRSLLINQAKGEAEPRSDGKDGKAARSSQSS